MTQQQTPESQDTNQEQETANTCNYWPIAYGAIFFITMLAVSLPFSYLGILPIAIPLLIAALGMGLAVAYAKPVFLAPYGVVVTLTSYLVFPESTLNPLFLWITVALVFATIIGLVVTQKATIKPRPVKSKKEKPVFDAQPVVEEPEAEAEAAPEEPVAEAAPAPAPQAKAAFDPAIAAEGITIIFGTESGNCEDLANMASDSLKEDGHTVQVLDAENVKADYLAGFANVLVITSTWGDGDPPSNAEELVGEMKGGASPDMSGTQFSVLALGDTSYEQFCKCGKDFDELLEKYGSSRLHARVDCDLDYEEPYETWLDGVRAALKSSGLKQKGQPAGVA